MLLPVTNFALLGEHPRQANQPQSLIVAVGLSCEGTTDSVKRAGGHPKEGI
jgi:hypothetical protein